MVLTNCWFLSILIIISEVWGRWFFIYYFVYTYFSSLFGKKKFFIHIYFIICNNSIHTHVPMQMNTDTDTGMCVLYNTPHRYYFWCCKCSKLGHQEELLEVVFCLIIRFWTLPYYCIATKYSRLNFSCTFYNPDLESLISPVIFPLSPFLLIGI